MTAKEIHAQRRTLEEQADHANRSYYPAHQAQVAAEAELHAAKAARTDALVEQAKGILGVDIEAALAREADAHAAVEEAKARGVAVHRAREESTRHLKEYLAEHFDVFGEQAVKLSERAEEALQKANRAVMLADNLWKDAVSAWAPLCSAKSIAGAPPFPLSGASPIPARPPAVSVERDEAAA
jgi:hypothetical protein